MVKNLKNSKYILVVIIQIVLISSLWLFANWLSVSFLPAIPSSILGLFLLLLILLLGVPIRWFHLGAYWLIGNMLLFFIPAVVAVVNYKELIFREGLGIAIVVVISTLLVMISTGLAVDFAYKCKIDSIINRRKIQRSKGKTK